MSGSDGKVLTTAIDHIFADSQEGLDFRKHFRKADQTAPSRQELALAATVLLVDLAASDENFEQREYQIISSALHKMFGSSREEVQTLISRAHITLANLRGVDRFAGLLREHLTPEEKTTIVNIIEQIIAVDGIVDGFEVYFRNKFLKLLGVEGANNK